MIRHGFVIRSLREEQLHPTSPPRSHRRLHLIPQDGNRTPSCSPQTLAAQCGPLALNQVDMRLLHDAYGGRDTEKMWYRGMADVTGVGRMMLSLDMRFTTPSGAKGQALHSEFIGVAVER